MAEDKTTPPDDKTGDTSAIDKLKSVLHEVMDEREAKAAAAKEEKEKDDNNPDTKRTDDKPTIFQTLFGG